MMAFVPGAQYGAGGEMRDVRMMRANVDEIVRMPFACSTLVAKGDRVYGFSADGHVMVARTGAQKVDAYLLSVPAGQVYGVTDDRVAVMGTGNTVYLVTLP